MARMDGVDERKAGAFARWFFREVRKRTGRLTESWTLIAHAPQVLQGLAMLEFFMDRKRRVPPTLRKLAELKVAVMVGCPT